jgi:hypothetical protein
MTSARPVSDPGCGRNRSLFLSNRLGSNLSLVPGRMLLGSFKHLNRVARHYGGDRVFVDELRVTITPQQYAKIVEPGHHAL